MKRSTYEQFAIVASDSASLFNKQLNEEIYRLKDKYPTVHFSESTTPFFAQIKYTETESIPESLTDKYELGGALFVCAQCPYYTPTLKKDGTVDSRSKFGECSHPDSEYGRAIGNAAACDRLYELINERSVKLCFTE